MFIQPGNKLLWTPPSFVDFLTVSVDGCADASTKAGMHTINIAAQEWVTGGIDDYTYFELLDHYGIDPLDFVGEVEEHIQLLIR